MKEIPSPETANKIETLSPKENSERNLMNTAEKFEAFQEMEVTSVEKMEQMDVVEYREQLAQEYALEINHHSEMEVESLDLSETRLLKPEENRAARMEYRKCREELIQNWETLNDRDWPQYTEDRYSSDGRLVERKGDRKELHHIVPLCLGGENSLENIVPLGYTEHRSSSVGIHRSGGPLSELVQSYKESQQ